jgi:hypothetical protein
MDAPCLQAKSTTLPLGSERPNSQVCQLRSYLAYLFDLIVLAKLDMFWCNDKTHNNRCDDQAYDGQQRPDRHGFCRWCGPAFRQSDHWNATAPTGRIEQVAVPRRLRLLGRMQAEQAMWPQHRAAHNHDTCPIDVWRDKQTLRLPSA